MCGVRIRFTGARFRADGKRVFAGRDQSIDRRIQRTSPPSVIVVTATTVVDNAYAIYAVAITSSEISCFCGQRLGQAQSQRRPASNTDHCEKKSTKLTTLNYCSFLLSGSARFRNCRLSQLSAFR